VTLLADHLAGESVSAADDFIPARREINEEVAIVGMSCRFPGGDNLNEFWDLLQHGKDAITEIPTDRWDNQPYYDPSLRSWNKTNSKWGGFLNKIDRFDPIFFNITPVEAKSMDPQQRLLLELTWEAMEDTGLDIDNWIGKPVGVFIGISNNEYAKINGPLQENDLFWSTSNSLSIAANRISYQFDFRGPSISIDTACSSSLSAVKLAFNSLQTGECEMAVAGGVNMILNPELNVNFSQAGALSPTGLCHAFDKGADGIVRSEGAGIIILKTLSRARTDGDRIYGIICGGALNHDGRTNGLTAPNPLMQEIVIRSALSNAKLSADQVQYIETHGTGTPLGDPIEVKALQKVYDEPASRKKYSIGSVKSNLGHLEAAAGIASVIKLALSIYKKQIPPTIHFKSLNPHISLTGSQLSIQQELSSWSDQYDQIVAGVSAFGFGGTNVHLILKSPDVIEKNEEAGIDIPFEFPYLFLLSARDPDTLKEFAKGYYNLLSVDIEKKEEFLRKLCYNLALRRSHHPYRLAISFADASECPTLLSLALQEKRHNLIAYGGNDTRNKDVVFVYSGHGGQWIGMGYKLLMLPAFRASIQETDAILKEVAGWSILDLLTSYNTTDASRYERVDIVQPLIFAIQVAYTNLLAQLHIAPSIVIGHSMGEVAAGFIAGAISLRDAVKIIVFRSRLLQEGLHSQKEESAMAIVKIAADKLEKYITGNEEHLSIAVHNGPNMVVVGGNKRKLSDLLEKLKVDKIACQMLRTPGAGHSPQMEPIRQKLTEQLKTLEPLAVNIPMYSTTRRCIVTGTDMDANYWGDNVRMTVQFYSGIKYLLEKDYRVFLEISPDALLASSIRENGRSLNKEAEVISVSKRDEDEIQNFYRAIGLMYVKGWDINKENLFLKKESHIDLLPYPWRRRRFWKEKIQSQNYQSAPPSVIDSKDYPDPEGMLQLDWILSELNEKDSVKNKSPLVVFTDNTAIEEALAGYLQDYKEPVYFVQDGDCFEINDKYIKIRFAERSDYETLAQTLAEKAKGTQVCVLFICTLNTEYPQAIPEYSDVRISKTFLSLNIFITTLMRNRAIIDSNVFVVTRGGQTVGKSSATTHPMHTALWGFVRSLIQEFASLPIMLIDLDPKKNLPGDALEILAEMNAGIDEDQVAYREGQRWAARLKKFPDALPSASYTFRIDRTYLITGGMGGIGLALAEWMVQKGARRIILLSRTQLPLRNTWSRITEGSPFYQRIQQIKKLESMGATLFTLSVDISNRSRLFEALDSFQAEAWPPIGGVFHLAGILSWQPGPELTEEEFMKVFLPKAFGSWHLHSYFKKLPLDFFVLFSSGSAIFNSPYLASYSAANAFLDGLASHRNEQGLRATSINWGFWSEAGMASQKLEEYNKNYIPTGLKQIRNNEAFNLLEGILSTQDRAQYIYIPFDWTAWIKRHPVFAKRPYMTNLTGNVKGEVQRIASKLSRQKILDYPINERRHQLESFMIKELASLLKIEEKQLDISLKINEIGIDSLMAMELKNQLETDLQIYLPVAKLLEGPTISEFAAYVLEQMAEPAGPTENGKGLNIQGSPVKSQSKLILVNDRLVESDQLIKDLDGMDENELDTLLKQLSERNDLK
jgi:acyl transferase domain-containing protein/acyl carrier protein